MPMYNCMLIDYKTMFEKSFFLNNAIIDEPRSIQVACTVASQISAGVASSQYGGQTFNRFDEVMAKYVSMSYIKTLINELYSCLMIAYDLNKEESYFDDMIKNLYWKDNKDVKSIDYIKENLYNDIIENIYRLTHYENLYFGMIDEEFKESFKGLIERIFKITDKRIEKEVYDSMQSLEYQINTISSTNGQTPFVSIGIGLGTSKESRLIQKSILKVRLKGLGHREITPTFPKLIFTICKGINFYKEDPNYDIKLLAMECSSKRMYPDILCYENVCKMAGGKIYYKDEEHRVVDIEKSEGYKAPMGKISIAHLKLCELI